MFDGGDRALLRAQRGWMWFRSGERRGKGPQSKGSGPKHAETQSDHEGFCALGSGRAVEPGDDIRRKASEILFLLRHGGGGHGER